MLSPVQFKEKKKLKSCEIHEKYFWAYLSRKVKIRDLLDQKSLLVQMCALNNDDDNNKSSSSNNNNKQLPLPATFPHYERFQTARTNPTNS